MTVDDVQQRVDEACRTLGRLHVPGCWPARQSRSTWPSFVQDYWERFAAMVDPEARAEAEKEIETIMKGAEVKLGPPSSTEIDRFEEVMTWFPLVRDEILRRTLWQVSALRAKDIRQPYAKIQRKTGVHRNTVRSRYYRALGDIAENHHILRNRQVA
jgi:hypothetical protein